MGRGLRQGDVASVARLATHLDALLDDDTPTSAPSWLRAPTITINRLRHEQQRLLALLRQIEADLLPQIERELHPVFERWAAGDEEAFEQVMDLADRYADEQLRRNTISLALRLWVSLDTAEQLLRNLRGPVTGALVGADGGRLREAARSLLITRRQRLDANEASLPSAELDTCLAGICWEVAADEMAADSARWMEFLSWGDWSHVSRAQANGNFWDVYLEKAQTNWTQGSARLHARHYFTERFGAADL